jgi:glycosyltransferase involved in cell wall biosynthesis
MSVLKLSVIVPTRDRPAKLGETLAALADQRGVNPSAYELIVVDDGSDPPAKVPATAAQPLVTLIRLEGAGRSAARNVGASAARGALLVFVDDDMLVGADFLDAHWRAHTEWPGALKVGSVRLPQTAIGTPFGRFRQRLEDNAIPERGGLVQARNFCTAQNMAIERGVFEQVGGFDPGLSTGEDQDLALRLTENVGRIVFVPDAEAIHNDDALGVEAYSERAERYMEDLVRFGDRHPDLPETAARARVNGPTRWGREPLRLSARKAVKVAVMWAPIHPAALALVLIVEKIAPNSSLLNRLYRLHLGAHLQRGYRRGLDGAHA